MQELRMPMVATVGSTSGTRREQMVGTTPSRTQSCGRPTTRRRVGRGNYRHDIAVVVLVASITMLSIVTLSSGSSVAASVLIPATIPRGGASTARVHRTDRPKQSATLEGLKNSLASALATGCSKTMLAPLDTLKTIQQHHRSAGTALTLWQAAKLAMARPNGFRELYVRIINRSSLLPCRDIRFVW